MAISMAPANPPGEAGCGYRPRDLTSAVFHQKASKGLQPHESLLGGAKKTERQSEAVEPASPALDQRLHVVHGDNRISADARAVAAHEIDGLFATEHVNRVVLLQIADQRKILVQDPTRSRIPSGIDNEDAKARCRRSLPILLDRWELCFGRG